MNFIIIGLLLSSVYQNTQQASVNGFSQNTEPKIIYQWSQLEFAYESYIERWQDINDGIFIPGISTPIDVDISGSDYNQTVFVTIPRFQPGIPVTFGKVTRSKFHGNNLIDPYPSWDWHKNPKNCNQNRLVSVFRTQIDKCGRLWVLDTGNFEGKLICPPQIIAFNLKTDRVVHRYDIPSNVLQSNSLLVTPVVDTSDGCMKTFVYMADCQGNFLVVYDVANNDSWNIRDKTFYPDPDFGTYTVRGESFDLMDGILGMAINIRQNPRKLYYHAMSSNTEHYVKIADILNKTRFSTNPESSPDIFNTYKGRRRSQSPAEAIDKDGFLYFGDVNTVTLNCWDTSTEYGQRHIRTLSNNQTILQFISGIKVINNNINNKQDLYFLSSRFQKVSLGTINPNVTNFRILQLPLNNLSKQKCSS